MRRALWLAGALGLAALGGCGAGDPAGCAELVRSICDQRARCTGVTDASCAAQVAQLVPCARDAQCPSGTTFNAGAVDQCQTDQATATCQDLVAGKVATSCTQTCR